MGIQVRIRRRYPRVPSFNAVLVRRLQDGWQHEDFAKMNTISRGGCMFVFRQQLGVGTPLDLLIALRQETIKAQARVVYERPTADGTSYEVGVEFTALSQPNRELLARVLGPRDRPAAAQAAAAPLSS